jgi:hypothetical protein
MELRGQLTAQDHVSAQWIHLRPRRWIAALGIGLIALAAWAFWFAFLGRHSADIGTRDWIAVGCVLYLALQFAVLLPRKWRKTFQQQKALREDTTFSVGDAGLEVKTASGHWTSPWDHYIAWREGKSAFLLYVSGSAFQPLPKRFFKSPAAIDEFRSRLALKIKER